MMKKIVLLILAAVLLLLPAAASADYVTYFDVMNDVKQLLGDDPDAVWTTTRGSAKSAAAGLEGFMCRDEGDSVICEKKHWTGEFRLTLLFVRDKLSAIESSFTGPAIQDLNYGPDLPSIGVVTDLTNRLRTAGLIPAEAVQTAGISLFPGEGTSAYGPAYQIDENTLLQTGYNSKSPDNPKFGMAFIVQNAGYDAKTGKLADQSDLLIGSWDLKEYSRENADGTITPDKYGVDNFRIRFDADETVVMFDAWFTDAVLDTTRGTWASGDEGFTVTAGTSGYDLCTISEDEAELTCSVRNGAPGAGSSIFVFSRAVPMKEAAKAKLSSMIEGLSDAFRSGDGTVPETPELTAEPAPEYQGVTDPAEQYTLGKAYYTGEGQDPDLDQALYWLHKSAAQGNADAQYELGRLYTKEFDDYETAAAWFGSAAKLEQPEAVFVQDQVVFLAGKGQEDAATIVELADAAGIEGAALLVDLTKPDGKIHIPYITPTAEDLCGVWDMSILSIEQSDGSMNTLAEDTTGFADAGFDARRFVFYEDGSVFVNTLSADGKWANESGRWEILDNMISAAFGDDTRYEGGILDNEEQKQLLLDLVDGGEHLGFSYHGETPDRLTTDKNNTKSMEAMDYSPYPVKAQSAEDFYGNWIRAYRSNVGAGIMISTNISYSDAWYTIDDSWMLFTETTEEGMKGTASSYTFRDGKLYTSDNLVFELNDNGWISYYDPADSYHFIWYFVDLDRFDENITITASANPPEAGETVKLTVNAPGADAIRLYTRYPVSWNIPDEISEEAESDSLEYRFSDWGTDTYTYYAIASYNGEWSEKGSYMLTITFVPSQRLKCSLPEVVHTGEEFYIGILEVEGAAEYSVRFENASGISVREVQVPAGYSKLAPLPAGEYKVTVTCTGTEPHTASTNITISDTRATGYSEYFEEGGEVNSDIILKVESNVVKVSGSGKITVEAPGADAIRLYYKGDSEPWKEVSGDTLEYRVGMSQTGSLSFYAKASFNGVWSDAPSNTEKISFVPETVMKFSTSTVIPSGEPFSITIYEVEGITDYTVRIEDAAGNPVREIHLEAGWKELEPLPAGEYKLTVTCTGNEARTASAEITVSDTEKKNYSRQFREPREVTDSIVLTVESNVAEAGDSVKVTVHAPGADGIRLYMESSTRVQQESEGDSLEYELRRYYAGDSETLYAEASYNGIWSEAVSNSEKVTFTASAILKILAKEIIRTDDTFGIGISGLENTDEYILSIVDESGNPVREERLNFDYTKLDPLPAGRYTLTVSAAEDPSHSVTVDVEFSDEAETGDFFLFTEEGRFPLD